MSLDCLVVARDSNLLRVLSASLQHAGITAEVCHDGEEAALRLERSRFDSVMVDCVELEDGPEILRSVRKVGANRSAIVFAIVDGEATMQQRAETGANFVLERPIAMDVLARSLRAARSLMVQERRRYFRFPVDISVSLVANSSEARATATDISAGGMALRMDKPLETGWRGVAEFTLPETDFNLQVRTEVVWVNAKGEAGLRFHYVPLRLRSGFEKWLKQRADLEQPKQRAS